MILRLTVLLTALCQHAVVRGEMSFLERQQMLAKQMWEEEQQQQQQQQTQKGGTAAAATAAVAADDGGDDYYDGYYEDYYEDARPEPVRFVPKAAPPRKKKGYLPPEEPGVFRDIQKPINYLDLLTAVATKTKCHSALIEEKNNVKRAQSNKERAKAKEKEKPSPAAPAPPAEEELVDGRPRKLSFKEKQERKARERQAREQEAARPKEEVKYQMGADCEDLICSACGAVVEEFAQALKREAVNPKMVYVADVARGFCDNKEIRSKYGEVVETVCRRLFDTEATGHLHALMSRFEETSDWDAVASFGSLLPTQRSYCTEALMCKPEMFVFKSEPTTPLEEEWTKECFTCRAVASHLEALSGLFSNLKDPNRIVAEACARLQLPGEHGDICRAVFSGSKIDDIGWLVKVHHEAATKLSYSTERFPSYMCGEIKQCVKLEDLNKPKPMEVEAPYW